MDKFWSIVKSLKGSNIFFLTMAGIVNAFGVIMFMAPVKLYDSGISGTAMLLSQETPAWCSLSAVLIVLNIPIFLFGLKREGVTFTIYAIYAVLVYAVVAWIITDVLPVDVSLVSPLAGSDLFLCALFGGIISGCGSGLAVRFGGAMDGIDIIAVMFAKKLGLSIGSFVMIYNVALYVVCGIVIGSWVLPLYSIVAYAAASKTVDFFVEGFDRAKAAFIITTKPDKVCRVLSEAFENGITTISAKGYYSDSDKTMVYFVVNRFQVGRMKNLVHEVDPRAYITLNEVADIFPANQEIAGQEPAGQESVSRETDRESQGSICQTE
ncbi:MAG: YitT family protein [Clostridium sp.]|nr:YitT family protein [Acetatifactor muris]MCM1526418.1 YitT family protein [Bacteroides sp.]MCM1563219.1 YitT family protein [Clostridium sp.]